MRDEELRRRFRLLAEPVADGVEPPDPRLVRERGRRRSRRLLAGTALVVAAALAGAGGAWAGLIGPPVPSLTGVGPASSAPAPPTTAPAPPSSAPASSAPATTSGAAASPTTTLPLGRVERLDAVQAIGGTGTVVAVGKGAILTTSNFGRTWVRVWRGAHELRDVDFVSAWTGWALGEGVLLGTVDGGQHWHRLSQPRAGPLRRVHFASLTLPAPTDGLPAYTELQCAAPGAAWVRVDTGDAAAGHRPYALYASGDGGAHWRGVLGEP